MTDRDAHAAVNPFPYTCYHSRLGSYWTLTTAKGAFPVADLRSFLEAEGWESMDLGEGVTAHHRLPEQQFVFAGLHHPSAVGEFAAWVALFFSSSNSSRSKIPNIGTLLLTPREIIGLAEIANHVAAAPRARLLARLSGRFSGDKALLYRGHPNQAWIPKNGTELVDERVISEKTPATKHFLNLYLYPCQGRFDTEKIIQHLAGYWGYFCQGDWHFLCDSAYSLHKISNQEASDALSYTGPAAIGVSPEWVKIFPRTAGGLVHAGLRDFIEWLCTAWHCRGQEQDYGVEWPQGVTVHHVCPPVDAVQLCRHGFGEAACEEPPAGSEDVLKDLSSATFSVVLAASERVIVRRDGLLPWLLYGSGLDSQRVMVGPHLNGLQYREALVALLVLNSDCPLYPNFEVDLSFLGLEQIPVGLRRIGTIRSLSLDGNELMSLPSWLTEFSQLEHLSLSNNPFPEGAWLVVRELLVQLKSLRQLRCHYIERWSLEAIRADLPGVEVSGD